MTTLPKPGFRPANPNFSSGPCAKRPGWSVEALKDAALGRSHRAKIGKAKLEQAGFMPYGSTPAEVERLTRSQYESFKALSQKVKLSAD